MIKPRFLRSLLNLQQNYSSMEAYSYYRSKSASKNQKTLFQAYSQPYSLPLPLWKQKDKITNPEKDTDMNNFVSDNMLNVQKTLNLSVNSCIPGRTLTKNRTAIQELQKLVTSRQKEQDSNQSEKTRQNMTRLERQFVNIQGDSHIQDKVDIQQSQNHSAPYYQNQLKRISESLINEEKKNSCLLKSIARIEQEKKLIQEKFEEQKVKNINLEVKNKQIQQLFKKQTLINLELQSMIGKLTLRHKKEQNIFKCAIQYSKANKESLNKEIESLKLLVKQQKTKYDNKIQKICQNFQHKKQIGQEQINSLLSQLKNKSQEFSQQKPQSKMKESELIVFQNKGNSTHPSFHNLDSSFIENQFKMNRCCQKEEDSEEIWRLKTELFSKQNAVTRPYCKTDRL